MAKKISRAIVRSFFVSFVLFVWVGILFISIQQVEAFTTDACWNCPVGSSCVFSPSGNPDMCNGLVPSVDINASPTTVGYNTPTDISWYIDDLDIAGCTAYGPWPGMGGLYTGSKNSNLLTSNSTFSIICRNAAGQTLQQDSVNVAVASTPALGTSCTVYQYDNESPGNYNKVTVWVDKSTYSVGDTVRIDGKVENISEGGDWTENVTYRSNNPGAAAVPIFDSYSATDGDSVVWAASPIKTTNGWRTFVIPAGTPTGQRTIHLNAHLTSGGQQYHKDCTVAFNVTAPPVAPNPVTATNLTCNSVRINWADVANETGYDVEYWVPTPAWVKLTPTEAANATYRDITGLPANTGYSVRVVAYNASGVGTSNIVDFTTPACTQPSPTIPGNFTATAGACESGIIDMAWDNSSNETAYRTQQDNNNDGVWVDIPPNIGQDVTSRMLTSIPTNQLWRLRVVAIGTGGSATSSTQTATIPLCPPPAPSNLTAVAGACDTNQINLSWSGVGNGTTGYQVYRSGVLIGSPTSPVFTDTGRTPGVNYTYTVRSVAPQGNSGDSTSASAVGPALCAQPNLTALSLTIPAGPYTQGTPIAISGTVRNNSAVNAGGFSDNFTYQWGGTGGTWLSYTGNTVSKTSLAANTSSTDTPTPFTPGQSGTLYIQYCIDAVPSGGAVTESTETVADNCEVSSAITVAASLTPTCTAAIPQNAVRHDSEEESSLVTSRDWSYAATDTGTKCEFKCSTVNYYWTGSACVLPDLVAANTGQTTGLSYNTTQSVPFTGNVTNNTAPISQGGWAQLEVDYDSNDATTPDYRQNAFGGGELGAFVIGGVKSLSFTAPANTFPVGNHRYRFNVDVTSVVVESNDGNPSNNQSSWVNFSVVTPGTVNLVSENLSVTGSLQFGQTLNLSASVRNAGGAAAGAFSDDFTYKWDGTGAWQSISVISKSGGLATGASSPDATTFLLRKSGTLRIQHCVDSLLQVDEGAAEVPNCTVSAPLAVSGPQLVSENLSISGTPVVGSTLTLGAQVRNSGGGSTGIGFSDAFYYRWEGSMTWYPIQFFGTIAHAQSWEPLTTLTKPALAAGASSPDSATILLSQAGNLFIRHCVDINNQIGTMVCSPESTGLDISPAASGCSSRTVSNCAVSASSDGASSGSCASGYSGSCSYTCNNGSWSAPSSNTCVAPTPSITRFRVCTTASCAWVNAPGVHTVPINTPLTINWSANADTCSGSGTGFSTGNAVSGNRAITSSTTAGTDTVYRLSCRYGSGVPTSRDLTVRTASVGPSLTSSSNTVIAGSLVRINWDTNNGNESLCTLTGAGATISLSNSTLDAETGYADVTISGRTTFTLSCGGQHAVKTIEIIPGVAES